MRAAKQKEMFEISDLRREILHLSSDPIKYWVRDLWSVCLIFPLGGTFIFSYIRRLGLFFVVQNFEFPYFWVFQKTEYFLGYKDFVAIFLGSSQTGLY